MEKWIISDNLQSDYIKISRLLTTKKEAKRFLELTVRSFLDSTRSTKYSHLHTVVKTNIGYHTGLIDVESRRRVEELFDVEHPFFGKVSKIDPPTSEEAFFCGVLQKKLKEIRKKPIEEWRSLVNTKMK